MLNDLHDPPGMERDLEGRSISKLDRWLYCRGYGHRKGFRDSEESEVQSLQQAAKQRDGRDYWTGARSIQRPRN